MTVPLCMGIALILGSLAGSHYQGIRREVRAALCRLPFEWRWRYPVLQPKARFRLIPQVEEVDFDGAKVAHVISPWDVPDLEGLRYSREVDATGPVQRTLLWGYKVSELQALPGRRWPLAESAKVTIEHVEP